MNGQKITGFVLLGIGVGIILYALVASYGIFTGTEDPPEFYSVPVQAPAGVGQEKTASRRSLSKIFRGSSNISSHSS